MVDECPDSDLTYTESKRPHGVYVYGLLLMIQNRALRDTSSSQLPLPPHIDTPATLTKKTSLWLEWLGWPCNGGKTAKEYVKSSSLSLSLSLYFS